MKRIGKGFSRVETPLFDAMLDVTLVDVDAEVAMDSNIQERIKESQAKESAPRRRRGVVIQDPEETAAASVNVHLEVKPKDKGKDILIEEPKPMKGQAQIGMDEGFARQLEAELNANINWDDVIE
nr:hypothetical protein [Tanacetum cinerariifolium]